MTLHVFKGIFCSVFGAGCLSMSPAGPFKQSLHMPDFLRACCTGVSSFEACACSKSSEDFAGHVARLCRRVNPDKPGGGGHASMLSGTSDEAG